MELQNTVKEALNALYHHPDDTLRMQADRWLQDFQRTLDAWQVLRSICFCFALLLRFEGFGFDSCEEFMCVLIDFFVRFVRWIWLFFFFYCFVDWVDFGEVCKRMCEVMECEGFEFFRVRFFEILSSGSLSFYFFHFEFCICIVSRKEMDVCFVCLLRKCGEIESNWQVWIVEYMLGRVWSSCCMLELIVLCLVSMRIGFEKLTSTCSNYVRVVFFEYEGSEFHLGSAVHCFFFFFEFCVVYVCMLILVICLGRK